MEQTPESIKYSKKADKAHGGMYLYHLLQFRGITEKVTVVCKKHGPFEISAQHHLYRKQGCKQCWVEDPRNIINNNHTKRKAGYEERKERRKNSTPGGGGFRHAKPGIFYMLVSDELIKVGITNSTAESRCACIKKSSGEPFYVLAQVSSDSGAVVQELERRTLKWLRSTYEPVGRKFDGYTECFKNVESAKLLDFVLQLAFPHNNFIICQGTK